MLPKVDAVWGLPWGSFVGGPQVSTGSTPSSIRRDAGGLGQVHVGVDLVQGAHRSSSALIPSTFSNQKQAHLL